MYLERLEKMSHLEILTHLQEQGFERLELEVTRPDVDEERIEYEKKNKK